jgi:hypothetical protein
VNRQHDRQAPAPRPEDRLQELHVAVSDRKLPVAAEVPAIVVKSDALARNGAAVEIERQGEIQRRFAQKLGEMPEREKSILAGAEKNPSSAVLGDKAAVREPALVGRLLMSNRRHSSALLRKLARISAGRIMLRSPAGTQLSRTHIRKCRMTRNGGCIVH